MFIFHMHFLCYFGTLNILLNNIQRYFHMHLYACWEKGIIWFSTGNFYILLLNPFSFWCLNTTFHFCYLLKQRTSLVVLDFEASFGINGAQNGHKIAKESLFSNFNAISVRIAMLAVAGFMLLFVFALLSSIYCDILYFFLPL